MTELKPGQIEINGYRIDRAGLWSGERRPVKYNVFEPGGKPTASTNDRDHAAGDGRVFGIDTLGGRDVALEMFVDTGDIVAATRAYNDLAAVWHDPTVRLVDGVTVPLRYRPFPGLPTRVMYGRPRKFDPVNEHLLEFGRVDVVATFETDDPMCWEDPELIDPVVVAIAPPPTGGWTAPFTAPIVVATTTSGFGEFYVAGSVPTPLIARINGPLSNPVIDYLGRWQLRINTTLLYDQHIDIDTRPQKRTVLRSDGLNLAGAVDTAAPPMADLLLHPGPAEVVLRGLDPTGTASLTITPQAAAATPYWV